MFTTSKMENPTLVADEANTDPENVKKQYIHDLREHHCHLKDLLRSWMKARIKLKLCKPEPLKNGRPPP